jgi:ComF family protein
VADAVKLLKFSGKVRITRALGALMREFACEEMDSRAYDYIVPVPLHRVRERARGFNQSGLLAQEVACFFSNAAVDESLRRIRPTRVQSKAKSEAERRRNVRGAFAVVGGQRLRGGRVLLVDDVVTTGETISECAKELRKAGACFVDVFATALAVRHA